VLPTAICPGTAYAAPLTANTILTPGSQPYPVSTIPDEITAILVSSLQAFSTSLLSSACGRDVFSHVSTCADCYAAYRDWACRVVIPQCVATNSSQPDQDDYSIKGDLLPTAQTVFRTTTSPRNPATPPAYEYTELLPCLSTCNAVDRACPVFLAFRCPLRGITAKESYAYLGSEVYEGDGSADTGPPALDRWGNRWCNG
jgi:calcium channel MID1